MEQTTPTTLPITSSNKQGNGKGLKIATVVASIVAVCGIGFGVYGMMQSSQKDSQISDLKVQVKEDNGTITAIESPEIETTTDNGTVVTIVDKPSLSEDELSHYIYIAQWNLKIALPASLKNLSYRYYMGAGYTSLEVTGVSCAVQGQCQYSPAFADLAKTNFPLGTIVRYYKDTGPTAGAPEKIFTIGDYNYYYVHPQAVYSVNSDEVKWESESVNMIKDALVNSDNYSAI